MTAPSDPRLLVLHGLRLKGIAEPRAVAEASGLDEGTVAEQLPILGAEGLVLRRDGRLAGWALTTEGRAEQERLVAAELDASGCRDAVRAAYDRFLVLNPTLLQVCTRWQVRERDGTQEVNDHTDADYDAAVVAELGSIHERAEPVLVDLEAVLARFGRYRPALDAALAAVRAGDHDRFTKPVVPSYHTLWFELHEDLLSTLSIERSSEVPA